MRRTVLGLGLIVAACGSEPLPTTEPPPPVTATPAVIATTAPPSPSSDLPVCLAGDDEFIESGDLPVRPPPGQADATHIAAWRLLSEESCERLVISVTTSGGAPARLAGHVEAFLKRDVGVVRVALDASIRTTAVIDHVFEGRFVDRVYVVRSLADSVLIDIHLAGPAAARISVTRTPATVVVDLTASGDLDASPALSDEVVVLEPSQPRTSYPLEVAGYARSPVLAELQTEGTVILQEQGLAARYDDMWGEYRIAIADGPTGPVQLYVGDPSSRTGITLSLLVN